MISTTGLSLFLLRIRELLRNVSFMLFMLGIVAGVVICIVAYTWLFRAPSYMKADTSTMNATSADNELFQKANQMMEANQCGQAIVLYKDLMRKYPDAIGLLNNAAICYSQIGQWENAKNLLEQAINRHESLKVPHENLSMLYGKLADLSYQRVQSGIDIRNSSSEISQDITSKSLALTTMQSLYGDTKDLVANINTQPMHSADTPSVPSNLLANMTVGALKSRDSAIDKKTETRVEKPSVVAESSTSAKETVVELPKVEPLPQPLPKDAPKTEVAAGPVKAVVAPSINPTQDKSITKPEVKSEPKKNKAPAPEKTVTDWAKAWSSRNLTEYFSHYSSQFRPEGGTNVSTWRKERTDKIGGKKNIRVDLSRMKVTVSDTGKSAQVSFIQSYRTESIQLVTKKTLHLNLEGGRWRIVEEKSK